MAHTPRHTSIALALLGALLVGTSAPPTAAAEGTFDWVLVEVPVPAGTLGMSVGVLMYGTSDADHIQHAMVFSLPDSGWPTDGLSFDQPLDVRQHQGVAAGVSVRGVSQHVSVGLEHSTDTYGASAGIGFAEYHTTVDRTFYFLVLAPSIGATSYYAYAKIGGVDQPIVVTTGAGATAVRMSDITAGYGATVSPASTGSGWATKQVPTGIAGAMTWNCIGNCNARWHSPDGRSAPYDTQGMPLLFMDRGTNQWGGFGGPAGTWQWDWAGVTEGESIALYAPVGDAWQHFQQYFR